MVKYCHRALVVIMLLSLFPRCQDVAEKKSSYALYPQTLKYEPEINSPSILKDSTEIVVAVTKENKYAIIPVTLENSPQKGQQLEVDETDFPTLARTGLHSLTELESRRTITGRSLAEITELGRPGGLSTSGFMAEDENILSVLTGDNRLVQTMGLTHPQMARPLFHVWNMILTDLDLNRWNMAAHAWENITKLFYNDKTVHLEAFDTKGGQQSIFDDGIEGGFHIRIRRELEQDELSFLQQRYAHLRFSKFDAMVDKLTEINTGEMEPYYIMRYGFYEGHTFWRTDPIAITFIFGLKSITEIDSVFNGELHKALLDHFTE